MASLEQEDAKLTARELRCCHMSQFLGSWGSTVEEWRAEFHNIPGNEHCRDCPMFRP